MLKTKGRAPDTLPSGVCQPGGFNKWIDDGYLLMERLISISILTAIDNFYTSSENTWTGMPPCANWRCALFELECFPEASEVLQAIQTTGVPEAGATWPLPLPIFT